MIKFNKKKKQFDLGNRKALVIVYYYYYLYVNTYTYINKKTYTVIYIFLSNVT